jgi:hypothetical protein
MDLYHLRQGLHVIAASWDYHGGAESSFRLRKFGSFQHVTNMVVISNGLKQPVTDRALISTYFTSSLPICLTCVTGSI